MTTPANMPPRRDQAAAPDETPHRRTQRGRRGGDAGRRTKPTRSSKSCPREGCRGLLAADGRREYCSFICGAIVQELDRAQRICEALGPNSPLAVELWTETVELSDGWTRHIELDRRLYREALSAGYTDASWRAIKSGN